MFELFQRAELTGLRGGLFKTDVVLGLVTGGRTVNLSIDGLSYDNILLHWRGSLELKLNKIYIAMNKYLFIYIP